MILITKNTKPYININKDGVTLFNQFETIKSKKVELSWNEIRYIDVNIQTSFRGYKIIFKIQTNINENISFTSELLNLDQDWEDIIINLQNYNKKVKFNKNRILEIYDSMNRVEKTQGIWIMILLSVPFGILLASDSIQDFNIVYIIFLLLGLYEIYQKLDYRTARKYNNNLERNSLP